MADATHALLLRPEEAADRLGICRDLLYKLMRAGEIRSLKIGLKSRRLAVTDLEAYIARLQAEQS